MTVLEQQAVHARHLATSTQLSQYYYAMAREASPANVVAALNNAKISFVLVGAHGLAGWMPEPRATKDVDVIVALRQHKQAIRTLLGVFEELEAVELDVVTRLRRKGTEEVAIDVMKPLEKLFSVIFKNAVKVRIDGHDYRVPTVEMALAMKFAPMISLSRREEKKYLDAHDFIVMTKTNPDADLHKLEELGNLVYNGGGREILEMVRRVRAGEPLTL